MQGALIVSGEVAVRKSLTAILQPGRAVAEADTIAECLAQAAAEKFDFIFIDGMLQDGSAEELAVRLNALGYGPEIIPILLSLDRFYQQPFRQQGVRCCIAKPFNVEQVNQAVEQVEELLRLSDTAIRQARKTTAEEISEAPTETPTPVVQSGGEIDVREVSQRFRRLLARLQSRDELLRAFADSVQEQFDVDNVVILLPADGKAAFEIICGDLPEQVRRQFYLPLDDPLLQTLIRLGEPIWVHDCERLGRSNALSAIRCGERLNIQILCPVLSRGRLKALVGLSRFHRYSHHPSVLSLLRLFLTFFAEILESSELYGRVAVSGEMHQAVLESLDAGLLAASDSGIILHLNTAAAVMLGVAVEELRGQAVEKAGSLFAHHVRTALAEGVSTKSETCKCQGKSVRVSARPLAKGSRHTGALLVLEPEPGRTAGRGAGADSASPPEARKEDEDWWGDMARAIAHNFKNAFVPVQTCAELLPSRYQEESFRSFFLETVGENIERINQWIEQLLGLSRLGQDCRHSSFPLREIIEAGIAAARRRNPRHQVELKVDYALNDTIKGGRELLERAFAEIVANALEAVQDVPEPVVEVSTEIVEGGVAATIRDNGGGVEDGIRESLFQPFVSSKLSGSLGLGLTYAQRAIGHHQGSLEIDSAEDGGTVVRVCLPQARAVKKAAGTTAKTAAESETP